MAVDIARVRSSFPALVEGGVAYFDGPGGSQVPRQVAEAVATTMTAGVSNRGTTTRSERRADQVVTDARAAVADLLGCPPNGVVFGRSMTQLTYDVSRTLARTWGPGDEVVVTRLDHDANIRPWVTAAEGAGATVRWVGFDRETAELAPADLDEALSPRTRLLAVTAASNLLGTRPDLAGIVEAAHAHGALVYVDGVHLTPHAPVDVASLGADFFACSPYKFLGPHLGVLAADPGLLDDLHPDKLLPSSNAVPERFELGTLPYELLAGVTAAVDFLADLASNASDRRGRVLESMAALEEREERLLGRMLDGLASTEGVTLYGTPKRRTPTVLFTVDGHSPRVVHEHLAGLDVNAPGGHFYAIEASRWLGLGDEGGVRAGIAPYTTEDEVDRLVRGVRDLSKRPR